MSSRGLHSLVAIAALLTLCSCGSEAPRNASRPPAQEESPPTNTTAPTDPAPRPAPPPPPGVEVAATKRNDLAYGLNVTLEASCVDAPLKFTGTLVRKLEATAASGGGFTLTARFVPEFVAARVPYSDDVYQAGEAAPATLTLKADDVRKIEVVYPLLVHGKATGLSLRETVSVVVRAADGMPYGVLADGSTGFDPRAVRLVCKTK